MCFQRPAGANPHDVNVHISTKLMPSVRGALSFNQAKHQMEYELVVAKALSR